MKEKNLIRYAILGFWTLFWGLSVVDKIVPAVQMYWVGKDFFALFIKFFASLGIKDPMFATVALAGVAVLEVLNFVLHLFAVVHYSRGNESTGEQWFLRATVSSVTLFTLFSVGDQVFGDRFQLLEHGLFWLIIIASWLVFKHVAESENEVLKLKFSNPLKSIIILGVVFTVLTAVSIFRFANKTYANTELPVVGVEVVEGVYKFDFPFLAEKKVWKETINTFKTDHPHLKINYVYTGPSELNSKKKTHMLLYVFTEPVN